MVKTRTERNVDAQIRRLKLPRFAVSSRGTRKLTIREKRILIKQIKTFKKDFKKEGRTIGRNTILFRGKKFTKSGILI